MTPLAIAFMAASWSFVLGLAAWSFHRVIRSRSARKGPGVEAAEDPDDGGRAGE